MLYKILYIFWIETTVYILDQWALGVYFLLYLTMAYCSFKDCLDLAACTVRSTYAQFSQGGIKYDKAKEWIDRNLLF